MKAAPSCGPNYTARISRARHLAFAHPFAAEVLTFYASVAEFQGDLHAQLPGRSSNLPLPRPDDVPMPWELNLAVLLPHFRKWLGFVSDSGPAGVADAARRFSAKSEKAWVAALAEFWNAARNSADRFETAPEQNPLQEFLLLGFLQPYCEFLAARQPEVQRSASHSNCPRCGAAPVAGVLRPEGDGGKRRLLCSFCMQEWDTRRIYCVACGEEDEKKLPVYIAERFPHIRIESCDACKSYVRTIDLTKNGNSVPVVDDLAAIPLTLWAEQHGYTRLKNNLLGT
jgi:formate dehydrogenase accessory protein FdhE